LELSNKEQKELDKLTSRVLAVGYNKLTKEEQERHDNLLNLKNWDGNPVSFG
jgi:succinate dehydrogenase flavin-adding protein (antitoxin of CptAB toxin-antitoxin module)